MLTQDQRHQLLNDAASALAERSLPGGAYAKIEMIVDQLVRMGCEITLDESVYAAWQEQRDGGNPVPA